LAQHAPLTRPSRSQTWSENGAYGPTVAHLQIGSGGLKNSIGLPDDHLARVETEAREAHVRAQAAEWATREESIREDGYNLACKFLEKCKQMLEFPLEEKTDVFEEDGKTIIRTVRPGNWNLATAAKFLDTAYRTASLSAGMETERIAASIQMREQNAAILQAVKESLAEVIGDDAIFVKVLERLEQKISTIERQ
jgi:hypothetical protein